MSQEIKETIRELCGLAIGKASMCWNPRPKGVFDLTLAGETVDQLVESIMANIECTQPKGLEVDSTIKQAVCNFTSFLLTRVKLSDYEQSQLENEIRHVVNSQEKQSKPLDTTSEVEEANEIAFGIFTGEKLSEITKEHIKFAVRNLLNAGYRLHLQAKEVDSKWPEKKEHTPYCIKQSPVTCICDAKGWNHAIDAFMKIIKQSKPELLPLDKQLLWFRISMWLQGPKSDNISNDVWDIVNDIYDKFGRKAVIPNEIELSKAHSKAILDWMNYERSSNYQQHSIRIRRDEFMAKSIIKHLEALNS